MATYFMAGRSSFSTRLTVSSFLPFTLASRYTYRYNRYKVLVSFFSLHAVPTVVLRLMRGVFFFFFCLRNEIRTRREKLNSQSVSSLFACCNWVIRGWSVVLQILIPHNIYIAVAYRYTYRCEKKKVKLVNAIALKVEGRARKDGGRYAAWRS